MLATRILLHRPTLGARTPSEAIGCKPVTLSAHAHPETTQGECPHAQTPRAQQAGGELCNLSGINDTLKPGATAPWPHVAPAAGDSIASPICPPRGWDDPMRSSAGGVCLQTRCRGLGVRVGSLAPAGPPGHRW